MITNYPKGYIGSTNPSQVAPSTPVQVPNKTVTTKSDEYGFINKEIAKLEKTLRRAEQGKSEITDSAREGIKKRLDELYYRRDQIENVGTQYGTYTAPQTPTPQEATAKDVTIVNGMPLSKAQFLQTAQEVEASAKYSASMMSTSKGIILVGDTNARSQVYEPFSSTKNFGDSRVSNVNLVSTRNFIRDNPSIPLEVQRQRLPDISLGQESIAAYKRGGVVGIAGGTTLAIVSLGIGAGKGILGAVEFISPYSIQQKKWQIPIVTPIADLVKSVPSIPAAAQAEPFEFAGQIGGGILVAKYTPTVIQGVKGKITATGTYRAPETVFAKAYLEGGELPKATSVNDALARFNKISYEPEQPIAYRFARDDVRSPYPVPQGSIAPENTLVVRQTPTLEMVKQPLEVAHASPVAIASKGFFVEDITIRSPKGSRGAMLVEDPDIIFTTPKGETSGAFLGIGENPNYVFTLNPFKSLLGRPTITEITVKSVEQYPREVILKPGFEAVKEFNVNVASKSESAFITKRSELGQGNIPAQFYETPVDVTVPWKRMTVLKDGEPTTVKGGTVIKKGTNVLEPGSPELESGVAGFAAVKNNFMDILRGGQEYTVDKGVVVAIKKAKKVSVQDATKLSDTTYFSESKQLATAQGSKELALFTEGDNVKVVPVSELSSTPANIRYISPSEISSAATSIKSLATSSVPSQVSSKVSIPAISSTPSTPSISSTPSTSIANSLSTPSTPSTSSIPSISIPKTPSTPSTPPISSTPSISIPKTPSTPSTIGKPPIGFPPNILPKNIFAGTTKDSKRKQKFTAQVKRKGKFQNVGTFDTEQLAFSKGRAVVESTAAASFKVVGESNVITPSIFSQRFTRSKRDRNVVVQKREFRMSNVGEHKDITMNKRRLI